MALDEGYAFVGPRTPDTARALLDLAANAGLEPWVVRTVIGGYQVPVKVAKAYEKNNLGAPEETPAEAPAEGDEADASVPDDSWKNADIVAWAQEHEVDLGGATKKADMLAAIHSADKE